MLRYFDCSVWDGLSMHFRMLEDGGKRTLGCQILSAKNYCHTRLHLGFPAMLKIWQVPACKGEPRSGYIMQLEPPTQPPSPTDQFKISSSLQDGATKWHYFLK